MPKRERAGTGSEAALAFSSVQCRSREGRRLAILFALSLALSLLFTLTSCQREATRASISGPPNILLVVIDTLGAEHVGYLHPELTHTANLDRLAREGLAFRRAYSPAPWTQPAIASLITSRMPSGHGVLRLFDVLDAGNETLPELLSQRGYETAGFVTHLLLRREFGFAQGFAHYDESAVGGHKAITSKRVTDRVIQWLEGRESTAPFFLFVHYFDPHFVFHHHPEHDLTAGYEGSLEPGMDIWDLRDGRASLRPDDLAYLIGLHREEIAFTDSQLGRLLAQLQKRDLEQSTLVVVTADHGEEFMRHGWIGHTRTLYDELLHVPLVIRLPGAARRGEVETPVSLLDLLPTLIEVVDRKAGNASWEGLSLVPELEGRAAGTTGRDLYAEVSFGRGRNATGRAAQQTAFKTALLGSQLKLIHDLLNGGFELYDRSRDRDELRDLSGAQPAEAEMRTRLLRWENSRSPRAGEPSEASPDTGETEGP